jgi:hypothetical protein
MRVIAASDSGAGHLRDALAYRAETMGLMPDECCGLKARGWGFENYYTGSIKGWANGLIVKRFPLVSTSGEGT